MAHAAILGALTDDLIGHITASNPRKDARQVKHLKDSALRNFRSQQHVRVNQFEIDARFEGLLEKFYVLNNQPLADALKPRLDELATIPNKWRPELLALLLALSDRPVEKTDINHALEIVPAHPPEQQLTWAEIIADDPLDEEGIWDDVENESDYSEHRAPSLSDESVGEPTTSTHASSLDEEDAAAFARAFIVPKYSELLDQVRDLRHRMAGLHPGSELTELQVTRQVLSMLEGSPTDLFEIGRNGQIRPRFSCRIVDVAPSTLDRVLRDFALLGSQVSFVRKFAVSDQLSVVLQSFQAAIQDRLYQLGRTLSGIEQYLLRPENSTLASLLKVQVEIDLVAGPLVRLTRLVPDNTLKHNSQAVKLLDNLFEQACNLQLIGEDHESVSVANLLFKCLEPYLRPVKLWMTEGKLIASNELFFVRSDDGSSNRGSIWRSRFTLLRNLDGSIFAPRFMQSIAEKIFKAGKSVMLLEALGHKSDISSRSAQSLDIAQIVQSVENTLLPFSEVFKMALNHFADALEGSETHTLRQVLTSQCGLQATIKAINHLYFGMNGACFQTFAYDVFQRMDRGIGWDDRFLLTELAQTAFESIDAVHSDHITVRVEPRNDQKYAAARQGCSDILGRVSVDYSITWVLQNVLTNATLSACQGAFTFLLRLYRAQFLLNQQEWTLNIMVKHSELATVKELIALRQQLSWFAFTLRCYVCEMLSIVSKQLTSDLEAASDVDGMVAAFDRFSDNIISKLLLHENMAPIRSSILVVFDLYEDLALKWRHTIKHISKDASQPTPRQLVVQRGLSDRRSRLETDDTVDISDDEVEVEIGHLEDRSVLSVQSLLEEYKRQLSFLLAGLRSVSRVEGEAAWIILSERLQWGVSGSDRR
ncbi:hypothetical protein E4T39_05756 [Aureobasidium subglaciale]|nr:hypothetical protein E4T39_05756 [Aureobasidium subglaciale]